MFPKIKSNIDCLKSKLKKLKVLKDIDNNLNKNRDCLKNTELNIDFENVDESVLGNICKIQAITIDLPMLVGNSLVTMKKKPTLLQKRV